MTEPDPHDRAFFEQMRGCRDNYRLLADALHAIVGHQRTALDIGCGIGLQTARLREHGWRITGAEYTPVAIEMREPGVQIDPFDLTSFPRGDVAKHDCVICTETAEHIPEKYADAIVANVAAHARQVIVWSAAAPGQEWHGHINLQRPAYWLERFAKRGWVLDEARTGALRELMVATRAQHWMGKDNFCVLVPKVTYQPIRFVVTSTTYNAEKFIGRCMESVERQTYRNWVHHVIDADSEDNSAAEARQVMAHYNTAAHAPSRSRTFLSVNAKNKRLSALENVWNIWKETPNDHVIVWLDGDDWLASDTALEQLAAAYAHPSEPWLTYGQFMTDGGELGFASPYHPGESVRYSPWRATHLKTFRAGLAKHICPPDLLNAQGKFCELAIDRMVMYPMLEMAGSHQRCLQNILYVYNTKASWWASVSESERQEELAEVARMQALQPYAELNERPW